MIGIFDSGAGGLTAVKAIRAVLPNYDLIYFGDTARFPYGTQGLSVLKRYAEEDAAFLLEKGAKIIVIACHSASAAAGEYLKARLGVPVFDVVSPAIAEARQRTKNRRLGVIGTKATVQSGIYETLLKRGSKNINIFPRTAPLLVPLVEERWLKRPVTKRVIRHYLRPLKEKRIDTLILACTHYPLLQKQIELVMGKNVAVINPAEALAGALKQFIIDSPSLDKTLAKNGKMNFYVSSDPDHFKQTADWWLGEHIAVKLC